MTRIAWPNDGKNKAPNSNANVTVEEGDNAYLDALGNNNYIARMFTQSDSEQLQYLTCAVQRYLLGSSRTSGLRSHTARIGFSLQIFSGSTAGTKSYS